MAIEFTLQPPEVTKQLRKEFDRRKMNRLFVRWLYRRGVLDKYADVINLSRAAKVGFRMGSMSIRLSPYPEVEKIDFQIFV
jgi:hypothetical protein